ncbi:polysaccharide deacetylase family protein [uncultured Psychroserpens sp.]|uniref:polysaccharide deacetylase family protein n=1 Tax=uncultured Psychroserpens sp. TaxID=255436 RepID=UPI00262327E7|nr:polysaccharide deacetylase family protein [uncultured Psychroserpens sp.]
MTPNIYLAVTIDTECDKGKKWKLKQPLTFKNIYNGVVNNLQPIFDKYNVKATYLLSPEIMMDDKSVEVFKSFGDKVELGTHLHAEFIEPEANFECSNTSHFQNDFAPEIERAKLHNLTTLFRDTFGYQPLTFRAGRFGISKYSLKILQDLGYTVDSSVTPDMKWTNQVSGNAANFFGAPYQPYYPSIDDFRRKGDMNILQVPVTLINKKIAHLPLWIKRGIKLNKSHQHIIFNYATNFSKPIWLRPTYSDVDTMKDVTHEFIKMNGNKDLFLCIMFHSNEFEIDMSPYSLTKERMDQIIDRLDRYLHWLFKTHKTQGVGLSEFKNVFDKNKSKVH